MTELINTQPPFDWGNRQADTCMCRCDTFYRSPSRLDMKLLKLFSKLPGPGCGRTDNLRGISSDPEEMAIK